MRVSIRPSSSGTTSDLKADQYLFLLECHVPLSFRRRENSGLILPWGGYC